MKAILTIEDDVSGVLFSAANKFGVDINKLASDLLRESLERDPRLRRIQPRIFTQRTYDLGLLSDWPKVKNLLVEEELEHFARS